MELMDNIRIFDPKRLFIGCFLPDCLLQYKELSLSAKVLWAKLLQYSHNGVAYPSQEKLSKDLALSKRQIINLLQELEENGFLYREKPLNNDKFQNSTNKYYFLYHDIFSLKDITFGKDSILPGEIDFTWKRPGEMDFTWPSEIDFTWTPPRPSEQKNDEISSIYPNGSSSCYSSNSSFSSKKEKKLKEKEKESNKEKEKETYIINNKHISFSNKALPWLNNSNLLNSNTINTTNHTHTTITTTNLTNNTTNTNNTHTTTNNNNTNNINNNKVIDFKAECEKIGVDFNLFSDFILMRKKIKKPPTDRALILILKKLKQLKDIKNNDPNKVLEQSIVNSWQDVYELRRQPHNNTFSSNLKNNNKEILSLADQYKPL